MQNDAESALTSDSDGYPVFGILMPRSQGEQRPRLILSNDDAYSLARNWVNAWNSRDFERLAFMYVDDCEISSPYISTNLANTRGCLRGKPLVQRYWQCLCQRREKFEYELFNVFRGIRTLGVYYRFLFGKNAMEFWELDDSLRIVRSTMTLDQGI